MKYHHKHWLMIMMQYWKKLIHKTEDNISIIKFCNSLLIQRRCLSEFLCTKISSELAGSTISDWSINIKKNL